MLNSGINPKSTVMSPLLSKLSSWAPPWPDSVVPVGSSPAESVITGELTSVPRPPGCIPLSSPSSWLSAVSVGSEDLWNCSRGWPDSKLSSAKISTT